MASTEVFGNVSGLPPSQLRLLERVQRRRVPPGEVVSTELMTFLCEVSREIGRQVGVLIDRRGQIDEVIVGDASKITLPDVGRLRAAAGRFRGIRLVHTHLRDEPLTRDDLADLALLRLDVMCAIGMDPAGRPRTIHIAHLLPPNPEDKLWEVLAPIPAYKLDLDLSVLLRSLEEEFQRKAAAQVKEVGAQARALLVHVALGREAHSAARIEELRELCRTAGVQVVGVLDQRRPQADPKYLLGRGKLEEVVLRAMQAGADTLIFDPDLTTGQARAISDKTELKVLDRTMLILDIFAQHAKSRDGKLQVELAQLKYTLPRLQEKNTMMSRLTGGIGGRGPGETKLEINRRRARERIQRLEKEIDEIGRHRRGRRAQRERTRVPIVAIVGYTNAGKSTLLNSVTNADVLAESKLFATLDPTSRRLRFPREREIVLTDTVGFIRDLPKDLVNAFRATLEELGAADLLLHILDAADADLESKRAAVERILGDLDLAATPRLLVFNKADLLPEGAADELARKHGGLAISARNRESTRELLHQIEATLWKEQRFEENPDAHQAE
jgi:GTP-binding protein HflX